MDRHEEVQPRYPLPPLPKYRGAASLDHLSPDRFNHSLLLLLHANIKLSPFHPDRMLRSSLQSQAMCRLLSNSTSNSAPIIPGPSRPGPLPMPPYFSIQCFCPEAKGRNLGHSPNMAFSFPFPTAIRHWGSTVCSSNAEEYRH